MPGEESYDLFIKEKTAVLSSLAERAKMVADTLNNIPSITCNPVQGAMYAFPKVRFDNHKITLNMRRYSTKRLFIFIKLTLFLTYNFF